MIKLMLKALTQMQNGSCGCNAGCKCGDNCQCTAEKKCSPNCTCAE